MSLSLILTVPLILKLLPESLEFLVIKNRMKEVERISQRYNLSIEHIKKEM